MTSMDWFNNATLLLAFFFVFIFGIVVGGVTQMIANRREQEKRK